MSAVTRAPRRATANGRPTIILVAAAILAALFTVMVAPAGPAHAAAYRFWGYYQLTDGAWAFAQKGPGELTPKDGTVEGWRFAISGAGSNTRNPRATPTFKDVCGATPAVDGKKRVGVVIDYGRSVDGESGAEPPTPIAECAVVPTSAHGDEVLANVSAVRVDNKLVCAINAYPAKGCGGEVKDVPAGAKAADQPVTIAPAGGSVSDPTPTAGSSAAAADSPVPSSSRSSAPVAAAQDKGTDTATSSSGSTGTVVGVIVVIAALIAVAFVALRRRRQA